VELARPLLKKIPSGAFREILISRIVQMVPIQREALEKSMAPVDTVGTRPGPHQADTLKKSLVRLGLSILIQRPDLAAGLDDVEDLESLEMPGIPLLVEIIRMIRENPGLNPASILERYRGTEQHKHLEKLATWDHMIPDSYLGQEFEATIQQLKTRLAEQQVSQLLHRTNLSDDEKVKLRALLNQRSK
jgi:DNA primase